MRIACTSGGGARDGLIRADPYRPLLSSRAGVSRQRARKEEGSTEDRKRKQRAAMKIMSMRWKRSTPRPHRDQNWLREETRFHYP